ncbi:MAG: type II toxin-antitoxin system VapC family toxin [Anaerolineales bacterium]|nr:type II toxin-antitoxin system VapC family toxin [Anaerolineales bacterium]
MRLVDTDILIDHFHGVVAATEYIADALLSDGELFISVVSVTEILAGMRTGEEAKTEELFALFTIQPVNETIARAAGKYLNQFAASHRLELGDSIIAATARSLNAELITRNVKHYPMGDLIVRAPYERGRKK